MADLRNDERGQILLLAAFALAVIFIGLAMIANSAIYTENIATRGETADASRALEIRHEVKQAAGEAIEAANWNNHTGTYSTVRTTVDQSVQNLDQWAGLHAGREGTIVTTTLINDREGRRLVQTNGTSFMSSDANGSASDWTVAGGVSDARAFEIEVSDVNSLDTVTGSPFTVNVTTAPASNWTMSVAKDLSGDVVVEVSRENPVETAQCRVPDTEPIHIDVTGATINGEPCAALSIADGQAMHFGSGVAAGHDIRFEHGGSIEGNYSLIVDDGASIPSSNYGSPGGASQPFVFPAMYSATVRLEYHAKSIDYVTDIRVAPGERHG